MTNQIKAMSTALSESEIEQADVLQASPAPLLEQEQQYRAGAYGLLASLLGASPDQPLLDRVSGFAAIDNTGDGMALAMSMLGLASVRCKPEMIDDEFHRLFIGLGRGELVPYGSWYQTGFLMERPLGQLRDDLLSYGYQREPEVREPEDHVAALCEVMQLLIMDGAAHDRQAHFFNTHMAGWLGRFFADLSEAQAAVFYRAVGRFGANFTELERQYLAMQV